MTDRAKTIVSVLSVLFYPALLLIAVAGKRPEYVLETIALDVVYLVGVYVTICFLVRRGPPDAGINAAVAVFWPIAVPSVLAVLAVYRAVHWYRHRRDEHAKDYITGPYRSRKV